MECCRPQPYIGPSLANTCGGGSFAVFMTLLDTFVRNTCDLSEICERVKPTVEPDEWYDFVVIGGGSGGAAAAGLLAQNPEWKVLLLEAGGDEPPGSQVPSMVGNYIGNPTTDWNYKTDPEPYACHGFPESRCRWPRGKVLGGCSVLNGMMYMRGTPHDYDNWAKAGNTGWSYQDVLPVFIKSEDNTQIGSLVEEKFHGRGGPLTTSTFPYQPEFAHPLLEAASEIGYPVVNDLTGTNCSGFTIAQMSIRNGARLSSARAYLRPLRNHTNLHVMLNSTATCITFSRPAKGRPHRSRKRANGVEFYYDGHLKTVGVRKEVIVAAGAINSPQVLLLSGIGPRKQLEAHNISVQHHLPGVGENLHNHVTFYLTFELQNRSNVYDLDWASALEFFLNRNGPLSATGMSQVTARINSKFADESGLNPDLQIFFGGYRANCAKTGTVGEKRTNSSNHIEKRQIVMSPVVLHPKSRGRVFLDSADPLAAPRMLANYLKDPYDVKVLVEGVRVIQRLVNSTVLQNMYGIKMKSASYGDCDKNFTYDSDSFWECAVRHSTGPENHQAGSCKMGPLTDNMAVVDPELKVYGTSNVRVMDASIMPKLVSGNTHVTIVMIAEKGVQFIREKYNRKSHSHSGGHKTVFVKNQKTEQLVVANSTQQLSISPAEISASSIKNK